MTGGWTGRLFSGLALVDAKTAFAWFNSNGFDPQYLDGDASLTWYLALATGLGRAS